MAQIGLARDFGASEIVNKNRFPDGSSLNNETIQDDNPALHAPRPSDGIALYASSPLLPKIFN